MKNFFKIWLILLPNINKLYAYENQLVDITNSMFWQAIKVAVIIWICLWISVLPLAIKKITKKK
jgi:hypothetical protein